MKKHDSAKDYSASFEKRSQHYRSIAVQIVLIVSFSLLWMLVSRKDPSLALLSCLLALLTPLIGTYWAWATVYRARSGPMPMPMRYQRAWFLIGFAVLTSGLGRAYVTYLDALNQRISAPSIADLGFTLFYPLVFFGLIFMLTGSRPQRTCIRMGLDACIISLCLLSVSWFALLAPAVSRLSAAHLPAASFLTVLSYPLWDLFLMIALLMILQRCAERALHFSILLCGAGLLVAMCADTVSALPLLAGSLHPDPVNWNPLWFTTYLLMGLCARTHFATLAGGPIRESLTFQPGADQSDSNPSYSRLHLLLNALLFLPLSLLFALTLVSELMHDTTQTLFLVIVSAVVALLVATRLWLTTYENTILLQKQAQQKHELERLYQEKQSAYARLQEVNQRKDLFIMTTSHEIRMPLTAIKSYFGVMQQYGTSLSPEQHQDFLQQAAQRCDDLVALLAACRRERNRGHPSRYASTRVLHGRAGVTERSATAG